MTNVVQYDSNFNLSIGSSTSSSFNSSGSIIAASGFTGSLSGSVFGLGNTVSFSSSVSSDLVNLESKSASVDISITNINSFTASNANTSLNQLTGSLTTTGSNTFYGTQVFSGSVFIATDLIVQGSSSIQYISASSVSIGTNIVNLNTATPSVRYAGISVQDSGSSAGITGSMLWDSLCNRWIYSNPSTIGYSGGLLMSGPRATTLGSETTLTCNYIAKSGGGDHLYDSCIIDDGTTVCVNANLKGSGTACFGNSITTTSTISIGGADQGYQLDVKKSSTGDSTFDTIANFYKASTNGTQLLIRAKNGLIDLAGSYVIGGGGPNTGLSFSVSPSGGSPTEAMRITSSGVTCFSSTICACGLDLVNTGRTTLRIFSGPTDNEPGVEWWSSYPSAAERNWRIGTSDKEMGDFVIKSTTTCGVAPDSGGCVRIHINNSGVVCFACQVCILSGLVVSSISGTSITGTSMTVATDCSGVIVDVAGRHGLMKYYNYGTGLIGACSSTDGGISMWMGRFAGTITSPTAVYQDLKILNSGIAAFSCKIDTPGLTMGSIAHHQNYRNTNGCFAIFCASQGAVLYVTSMHNNGRSTAIINYANGVTGGASYSLLNQATPYGPAALGFALCANGWLYAHHYYGGPMDFYAIQIGGTFNWAF